MKSSHFVYSLVAGTLVATILMWIAWHHNSQCEIHCDGVVDWVYLFAIGFSGFIPVFLALVIGFKVLVGAKNT